MDIVALAPEYFESCAIQLFQRFQLQASHYWFLEHWLERHGSQYSETGEFCWNLVTQTLAEQMNASSADLASDIDEFNVAGLAPVESRIVSVPRVAESPVSFECRKTQIIRLQTAAAGDIDSWLILGEVVGVHIDSRFLTDGIFQMADASPILRAGGAGSYARIDRDSMFEMRRPR